MDQRERPSVINTGRFQELLVPAPASSGERPAVPQTSDAERGPVATGLAVGRSAVVRALVLLGWLMGSTQAQPVTFEGLPVDGQGYYNGDTAAGSPLRDNYTIVGTGSNFGETEYFQRWETGRNQFNNNYTPAFGSWNGWVWSRVADATTPGFQNQYAAAPGGGADGQGGIHPGQNYAVAYGVSPRSAFFNLPAGSTLQSLELSNTTYVALSMRDGDMFSKKFGGPTGNDPDFFSVTFTGHDGQDATGNLLGSITVFLADYRFANNALDYILTDWLTVDLAPLNAARSVALTFESSDVGPFGINTPTYLALDNLRIQTLPEPVGGLPGALVALACLRRRTRPSRPSRETAPRCSRSR
jgi:hypothetical protein